MSNMHSFLSAMGRRAKLFTPSALETVEANREICRWLLDPLARWAEAAYGEGVFDEAALGYAKYCLGVAQAQKLYEKTGRYTPEAMPEIVSGVYEDEGYMVPYMWAAILIYAFWPSMVEHLAMYRQFLRQLPKNARVLEMASGHGVLSLLAAEERPDITIDGFDISPPAVAVAKRLLAVSGHAGRVSFSVRDAIQAGNPRQDEPYDAIISAMLAEHLPSPRPLFSAMRKQVAQGGRVYFSTALESAQRDHVYEFNRESEPIRMAEAVGFRAARLISGASPAPQDGLFLPRAAAMVLEPRRAAS